jgi:glycosyltransferase involved in cell wall biosynthesis
LAVTTEPGAGRRARIVFLLPSFDIGGAERVVLRTAAGLDRARFDPFVLAFVQGGGRLMSELAAAGIAHHALKTSGGASPALVWYLLRWLRQHRCDVLMTYMFHANLAGRLVRRIARVPALVCSERGLWEETPVRVALNRLTASLATVITTNSQEGVRVWARRLKLPVSDIRLIYNGVDPSSFHVPARVPGDEVIIGNLARLHPFKGHQTLLDGLARLDARPDLPPWRCLVAGDGAELDRLLAQRTALGLERRLSFIGHAQAPAAFLQSIDLLVNTSNTEGMPNAILEAMASGLSVVATAVGGTSEVIEEGVTGHLVPARDPDALADALAELVSDRAKRLAMGEAGRARVQRFFSITQMVQSTEVLLDDVLLRRREPQPAALTS